MTVIADVVVQDASHRIAVLVDTEGFAADWFRLTRTYNGRSEPVRGDDQLDPTRFRAHASPQYLFDGEAPRGVAITYSVVAGQDATTTIQSATWATPVSHDAASCRWWVAPLTDPASGTTFEPEDQQEHTFDVANGEFRALGRADPVVLFGTRQTATGTLSAWEDSYDLAEALRTVLGRPEVMVLRSAPETGWGQSGRRYAALGPIGYARGVVRPVAPAGPISTFVVDLPWTEVAPTNVAVSNFGATYQDVANGFASYAIVASTFPTYLALTLWTPP